MIKEHHKMSKVKGKVKWFNATKGYGFITPDDNSKDVFCHYTAIESDGYRTLNQDDEVEFEVTNGAKGLQAAKVVVTKASAVAQK